MKLYGSPCIHFIFLMIPCQRPKPPKQVKTSLLPSAYIKRTIPNKRNLIKLMVLLIVDSVSIKKGMVSLVRLCTQYTTFTSLYNQTQTVVVCTKVHIHLEDADVNVKTRLSHSPLPVALQFCK